MRRRGGIGLARVSGRGKGQGEQRGGGLTDVSKHRRRRDFHHLIRLTLSRQLQTRRDILSSHHVRNAQNFRRARDFLNQLLRLCVPFPFYPLWIVE